MTTLNQASHSPGSSEKTVCAECEQAGSGFVLSLAGAPLCDECVVAYYLACDNCRGLVPRDEARARGDLFLCAECSDGSREAAVVDESLIESLVAEYVALHTEEKRLNERLEVIKEQLKKAAASRRGEESAVTLRAGEAAIRCSYRASLKCETEAVEALVPVLDAEEFAALFERKTSFQPVKERVAAFLAGTDESHRAAREAVRAALHETETVTLSVVRK